MRFGFYLFVILSLIVNYSYSQINNVSGTWRGNSYFLKNQIQNVYELTQRGDKVTGNIYIKQKQDSAKIEVEGTLKGRKLTLLGTEFIYKVGTACLSKIDLVLNQQEGFESLSGKWKGTTSLKTCAPGISGRIELFKEKEPVVTYAPTLTSNKAHTIQKDDFEGTELVKALSERKYYALVIAVEDYEDENITDLDNPIADASGLAQVLNTSYTFAKSDIRFLKNPNRAEIIEGLKLNIWGD